MDSYDGVRLLCLHTFNGVSISLVLLWVMSSSRSCDPVNFVGFTVSTGGLLITELLRSCET